MSAPEPGSNSDVLRAAELAALRAHLSRHAPLAEVLEQSHGLRAVHWPLPQGSAPKVSIIIPTMGRLALITPCIESNMSLCAAEAAAAGAPHPAAAAAHSPQCTLHP